jgi:hypothetical protein
MITMQQRDIQRRLKNLSKVFYSSLIIAIITGFFPILIISLIVIIRYYYLKYIKDY